MIATIKSKEGEEKTEKSLFGWAALHIKYQPGNYDPEIQYVTNSLRMRILLCIFFYVEADSEIAGSR